MVVTQASRDPGRPAGRLRHVPIRLIPGVGSGGLVVLVDTERVILGGRVWAEIEDRDGCFQRLRHGSLRTIALAQAVCQLGQGAQRRGRPKLHSFRAPGARSAGARLAARVTVA
jgi:hypothetical protein